MRDLQRARQSRFPTSAAALEELRRAGLVWPEKLRRCATVHNDAIPFPHPAPPARWPDLRRASQWHGVKVRRILRRLWGNVPVSPGKQLSFESCPDLHTHVMNRGRNRLSRIGVIGQQLT